MADVTIEYCVPCGFRERALDLQKAILTGLERELDSWYVFSPKAQRWAQPERVKSSRCFGRLA